MTDKPMQSQNTKLPRVTIQEVAREAGVDRSTVSRVFNQPEFTSRTNCPEGQVGRSEAWAILQTRRHEPYAPAGMKTLRLLCRI